MKNIELLTPKEMDLLLKYPAYISLLAANSHNGFNKEEKLAAIKISHIKTYSCNPQLSDFYKEADKKFEKNITELDNKLPKGKFMRGKIIKKELAGIDEIFLKLEKEYASLLHASMSSFKEHVSKANQNVLEYFIFPMPIKGITEE